MFFFFLSFLLSLCLSSLSVVSETNKKTISPRVVLLVQDRDQVQVIAVGVPAGLVVQRGDHHDARLLLDANGDGGAGEAAAGKRERGFLSFERVDEGELKVSGRCPRRERKREKSATAIDKEGRNGKERKERREREFFSEQERGEGRGRKGAPPPSALSSTSRSPLGLRRRSKASNPKKNRNQSPHLAPSKSIHEIPA